LTYRGTPTRSVIMETWPSKSVGFSFPIAAGTEKTSPNCCRGELNARMGGGQHRQA